MPWRELVSTFPTFVKCSAAVRACFHSYFEIPFSWYFDCCFVEISPRTTSYIVFTYSKGEQYTINFQDKNIKRTKTETRQNFNLHKCVYSYDDYSYLVKKKKRKIVESFNLETDKGNLVPRPTSYSSRPLLTKRRTSFAGHTMKPGHAALSNLQINRALGQTTFILLSSAYL